MLLERLLKSLKTPEDMKKVQVKLDELYKAHGYKDRKEGDAKIKAYPENLQKTDPKKFSEIQKDIMKNFEPMMKATQDMMQKAADKSKKEREQETKSKKDHPTGDAKKPEENKDTQK